LSNLRNNSACLFLWLLLLALAPLRAQDSASGKAIELEPFRVTVYSGKIPIIDGLTGKRYQGSNELVTQFAVSFNKLLLGYHKKLVLDEVKHLQFRIKLGAEFEQEMGRLTTSFGFKPFALDRTSWLSRERAIITRLVRKPFFKIKALVVWDLDRLNQSPPEKPTNKYARDIRFNAVTGRWERRITDQWSVSFRNNSNRPDNIFQTEKTQGLNLDTQRGFHFIEVGLPGNVIPDAFHDVSLTYPIFYSESGSGKEGLRHLQETLVANLHFIYDPFSWVARRDVRFRGGFIQDCQEHIEDQRLNVDDRDWFNGVLARFLSDVVTIKLQGAEEIYSLHMLHKRLGESPRTLGLGLDLLNWNKGETREAADRPEAEARISLSNPAGFRYVMIDAYQQFGEVFVEKISNRLRGQKEVPPPIHGRTMLTNIIEELSGLSYDEFARRAKRTQEARLARFKITRP